MYTQTDWSAVLYIQTDQPSGDTYSLILKHNVSCEIQSRKSPVESQISRHGLGVGVCLGDHHLVFLWGVLAGMGDDHGAGLGHLLTGLGDDYWSPWHQGGSGLWHVYGIEDGPPEKRTWWGGPIIVCGRPWVCGARDPHSLKRKKSTRLLSSQTF